ncbi:MAG TPA: hypothetical protein DCQ29_08220, partial [Chitinophagaceae bacterium]|nr:hypothetical protein [Chitinophagaceae bacterium]
NPELNEAEGLGKVLANKWYVDELYDAIIVRPIEAIAKLFNSGLEKGIDGVVNGTGRFVQYSSRQLRLLQSGQVGSYILFMVMGILVFFIIWWNQPLLTKLLQK